MLTLGPRGARSAGRWLLRVLLPAGRCARIASAGEASGEPMIAAATAAAEMPEGWEPGEGE